MNNITFVEKEFRRGFLEELIEEANGHYQRWASEVDEEEDMIRYHREFYLELITYLKNKLDEIVGGQSY